LLQSILNSSLSLISQLNCGAFRAFCPTDQYVCGISEKSAHFIVAAGSAALTVLFLLIHVENIPANLTGKHKMWHGLMLLPFRSRRNPTLPMK
jgi:hypothetical protein